LVLPGGFGTMDELFEALTLLATGKITKFPIVLVGSAYWNGLLGWLKETMLAEGNIGPEELELWRDCRRSAQRRHPQIRALPNPPSPKVARIAFRAPCTFSLTSVTIWPQQPACAH
jgi:predicted Rossmann-fold nucleotide-binding protein